MAAGEKEYRFAFVCSVSGESGRGHEEQMPQLVSSGGIQINPVKPEFKENFS